MEFQQNPAALPIAIVVLRASSNRIEALAVPVPALMRSLERLQPRTLVRVGG